MDLFFGTAVCAQVALRGGTVERVLVDRLRENFEPFGRVTNVSLSVYDEKATLVYATRQAAEFAVEAMDGQATFRNQDSCSCKVEHLT